MDAFGGDRSRHVLVLCMMAAIVLAGCTGGETDDPNNETDQVSVTQQEGLTMAFWSYEEAYLEGDPIMLELELENTAEGQAENIETALFGADFVAGEEPRITGSSSLDGVDLSDNEEGEDTTITWEIENPVTLPEGRTDTFRAGVRVGYEYETTTEARITLVSEDNLEGNETPVTPTTTAGPLDVAIDINSPQPVDASDGQDMAELFIPIQVTNSGSGEVADLWGDPQPIHVMEAEFPDSDDAVLDCPPTVSLFDGTRRMDCTATVPADVFERQLRMNLQFQYDYFDIQETSFSIQGT